MSSLPAMAFRRLSPYQGFLLTPYSRPQCICTCQKASRTLARQRQAFSSTTARRSQEQKDEPFGTRLRSALGKTKTEWRPIPIGLGIGFLGLFQFYRIRRREKEKAEQEGTDSSQQTNGKKIRPSGPWQVTILSTLPLNALSRLWGRFNSLTIPYYLRVPGFRLYSYLFGVDLADMSDPDLTSYPNLGAFFYRTLRPGIRPIDADPHALASPADGRVLQFGSISRDGMVEDVKGVGYSLDALLGGESGSSTPTPTPTSPVEDTKDKQGDTLSTTADFARVNGIRYSPSDLLGPLSSGSTSGAPDMTHHAPSSPSTIPPLQTAASPSLYYCVIYLAPGDYHRLHSPASWVCLRRRHFPGDLYSVSPYIQRLVPDLFTLNERVALLGRWRHGFMSVTPVGATNVGSIVVNFDRELRTNSIMKKEERGELDGGADAVGYREARYGLGEGVPLEKGVEFGGFRLGSTVVLVFEAPEGKWAWSVGKGQRTKVGERLGGVVDEI